MNYYQFIKCCSLILLYLFAINLNAADNISIYTTNYPLKYFAEQISGKHAIVHLSVPIGQDSALWSPNVEEIIELQAADLIVLNGASYEKWIHKVSLPKQNIVNTSLTFEDMLISTEEADSHSHGLEGEHTHSGTAYATWLDFSLAAIQAHTIYTALIQRYPQYKNDFLSNFERLEKELINLDKKFTEITKNNRKTFIIASYPVYQYMQRRYKLNMQNVLLEPDTFPGKNEWDSLTELLATRSSNWMIWVETPIKEIEEKLIQIGIKSLVINPCINEPSEGNFISEMQKNIQNLTTIFISDLN